MCFDEGENKMELKKYKIRANSTTAVIWNVMKKSIADEIKKLKKSELTEWEENNWVKKAETHGKKVFIPARWVKSMLINSAKHTRLIPHFATSKKETFTRYIQSTIVPLDYEVCSTNDLKAYGAFVGAQVKTVLLKFGE